MRNHSVQCYFFLMCANKVKENKYNFTPLSIFIQKVQGVWNLTPQYPALDGFRKWEGNTSPHTPRWSEVDMDPRPVPSFTSGFCHPRAKTPSSRNVTAPGGEGADDTDIFSSPLHSAALHDRSLAPVSSPALRIWVSEGADLVPCIFSN